ncbi:MAG: YtxH domain-containing protein [Fimbriimonadaceae bacterium]|nr:YtxH domain-containing protein [Chthonomonadaceae bacterium]MCO5297595.1 YtxH domain-containing protein [Fimbriimonadaceae bacterium]
MKEPNGKKRGGGLGFIAGLATGVAAVLLYAAGKERKLGDKVADGIDSFETKAKEAKDKAAHKAAELRDAAKEKLQAGKEKLSEAVHKGTNGSDA